MSKHDQSSITFPKSVFDGLHRDISQAHCSLSALVDLLRGNAQPDPACLAHLLSYIDTALVASDEVMSQYMSAAVNGGQHV